MKIKSSTFWRNIKNDFRKIAKTHGELVAHKSGDMWVLEGSAAAVEAFSKLATKAAYRIGYTGKGKDPVDYWLDHVHANEQRRETGGYLH